MNGTGPAVESAGQSIRLRRAAAWLAWLGVWMCGLPCAHAEDGYDLWLRYRPVEQPWLERYRASIREIVPPPGASNAAVRELSRALTGLLGTAPALVKKPTHDGALILGTPTSSATIAAMDLDLEGLGSDGYLVRSAMLDGHRTTIIAANSEPGVIYGAFRFLRLLQMRQPLDHLALRSSPRIQHRILDHWDNLDGTIERGYAGLLDLGLAQDAGLHVAALHRLCARRRLDRHQRHGAQQCRRAGGDADAAVYLDKAAALAAVFRPYGIRVYFSARFSAPIEIGGLKRADPLDPAVQAWWKAKADEIYRAIPDFGGFLVKANSEGQPGPQDYDRTQADGANMLADALAPHGGIVMWRAFVYSDEESGRPRQAGL